MEGLLELRFIEPFDNLTYPLPNTPMHIFSVRKGSKDFSVWRWIFSDFSKYPSLNWLHHDNSNVATTAVQNSGGQNFTLPTTEIMCPAQDFRTETHKGLGDDVDL